jgi:uncharacterized protein
MSLLDRFSSPTPKRILALDGGGMRGALTLGYLQRIETLLQDRYQNKDFRLRDYFDLIGGTSTGSIIATGLALGMKVSEINDLYKTLGKDIFGHKRSALWNLTKYIRAAYDSQPLEDALRKTFGETTLGDDSLTTGLAIIAKRVDTLSPWVIYNHPESRYYKDRIKDGIEKKGNKHIPLWQLTRASAAAPSYFIPIQMDVGDISEAVFVDGGVSQHNNPALQLFLLATVKGYNVNWATGEDNIFIVSLGTGTHRAKLDSDTIMDSKLWNWAKLLPDIFMSDATQHNQMMMQLMGKNISSRPLEIDREVGDLMQDTLFANDQSKKLFTYQRHNVFLEQEELESLDFKGWGTVLPLEQLRQMDNPKNIGDLYDIGLKAGERDITDSSFPEHFDI